MQRASTLQTKATDKAAIPEERATPSLLLSIHSRDTRGGRQTDHLTVRARDQAGLDG
jgi:hypothetical protein